MPYNWLTIDNSPEPHELRKRIIAAVEAQGGKVEAVFFAVGMSKAYALTEGPSDPVKQKALMKALPVRDLMVLLDVNETAEALGVEAAEADC
jgi:hypothetical protein